MRKGFSRGVIAIGVIVVVLAVAITGGVLWLLSRTEPLVLTERCHVKTPRGELDLEIEQARMAATIAAVAARRKLPERAVVIAYATGLQESKLFNLEYGDRDSVGIFQQRPSQGWGTVKQLQDPVYATAKFFAALVKVRDYAKKPLHEAAQEVQRSADGTAYAQHEEDAKILAAAFTGRVPRALHCWYPRPTDGPAPQARPDAARKELVRALGPSTASGALDAEGTRISAPTSRRGWLIASWSIAHAKEYGLRRIRFDGMAWSAGRGEDGWRGDSGATARHVELT
ncbi:hypothetical protein [Spongiactinospora sp. TRM90649]|uniref:hypothetical protein n=1 Tax=Spongiactinospora sp. TRM90649 TaxID=3031114 RepID=UPI0023F7F6B3|nr:hypothetical protein [Spongiactinospora sp. TRM90649]MDF5755444.1 hypothetical protein [Spongiactinospora sp. TRM90649]